MKGYFGIGVEGLSKPLNAGNLFRSAQAFGASFLFTVGASYAERAGRGGGHRMIPAGCPSTPSRTRAPWCCRAAVRW